MIRLHSNQSVALTIVGGLTLPAYPESIVVDPATLTAEQRDVLLGTYITREQAIATGLIPARNPHPCSGVAMVRAERVEE